MRERKTSQLTITCRLFLIAVVGGAVWGLVRVEVADAQVPDACSSGCSCVNCGSQDYFREPRRFREPPPPKMPPPPPAKSPWRKRLDDRTDRERKKLLRNMRREIVRARIEEDASGVSWIEKQEPNPIGTAFFDLGAGIKVERKKSARQSFPNVPLASENLRRSWAILKASLNAEGDMTSRYLMDQAAQAMNGGTLEVYVPAASLPSLSRKQEEELAEITRGLKAEFRDLHMVTIERIELEKKLFEISTVDGKPRDLEKLSFEEKKTLEELTGEYSKVIAKEQAADAKIRRYQKNLKTKVEFVMHQ